METRSARSVAVIGGGFCGALTVANLCRLAEEPLHITLINNSKSTGRGIAFTTYSDDHVLNVEARNMSAFPDDADHFMNWCKKNSRVNEADIPRTYFPRNVYGDYVEDVFDESLKSKPGFVHVELKHAEAIDIEEFINHYIITLHDGSTVRAEQVVIATGNAPPGPLQVSEKEHFSSSLYFGNPWMEESVSNLENDHPVLIVGTGLTMVDVVIGLQKKKFKGKIFTLSHKGFNILAHRPHQAQHAILEELKPPYELEKLFSIFRKHVRRVKQHGESGETVVDAVRSKTQEIWQHLSVNEKKRFMNHVRHLWGVARHRLPGDIHANIQKLILNGQMEVIAGRIVDITQLEKTLYVIFKHRKEQQNQVIHVSRIINCTGPQTDITKIKSPLFQRLLNKRMIAPDELKLGVHAQSDGRVIYPGGKISRGLFVVGSLLKGKLWESTAVPELRVQTNDLAKLVLCKSTTMQGKVRDELDDVNIR